MRSSRPDPVNPDSGAEISLILTLGQMVLLAAAAPVLVAMQLRVIASLVSYLRRSKRVKATFVR